MKHLVIPVFLFILLASSITTLYLSLSGPSLDPALQATVVVVCDNTGYGTGWWVNSEYVVTAAHVVDTCSNVSVIRGDWSSPATITKIDTSEDVAVLHVVNLPPWKHPNLELASSVKVGDTVWAVGYPVQLYDEMNHDLAAMSVAPRVAQGQVVWLNYETHRLEITAKVDKGNSGGPVINSDGAVVGLVSYARTGAVSELYYIVGMDGIAKVLDSAGIHYGVHHKWESPRLIAVAVAAFLPLIGYILGMRKGGR